jgi:hypothetical protein
MFRATRPARLRSSLRRAVIGPETITVFLGDTMLQRLALLAAVAIGLAAPASAQQTMRVGSTPTGVPFTFLDTQTNKIQGVMVDIVTAVG